eukprot:1157884-Pelagomonas_calceolata.AAC.8
MESSQTESMLPQQLALLVERHRHGKHGSAAACAAGGVAQAFRELKSPQLALLWGCMSVRVKVEWPGCTDNGCRARSEGGRRRCHVSEEQGFGEGWEDACMLDDLFLSPRGQGGSLGVVLKLRDNTPSRKAHD